MTIDPSQRSKGDASSGQRKMTVQQKTVELYRFRRWTWCNYTIGVRRFPWQRMQFPYMAAHQLKAGNSADSLSSCRFLASCNVSRVDDEAGVRCLQGSSFAPSCLCLRRVFFPPVLVAFGFGSMLLVFGKMSASTQQTRPLACSCSFSASLFFSSMKVHGVSTPWCDCSISSSSCACCAPGGGRLGMQTCASGWSCCAQRGPSLQRPHRRMHAPQPRKEHSRQT